METYVEPLNLSAIEAGAAGDTARYLFRMWRENEGVLVQDDKLTLISPQLMTLTPQAEEGDVPQISFLGRLTPFRKYFPEADSSGMQPTTLLPESYRNSVAHGYQVAINGEPWYDLQRTGEALGANRPDIMIERLILKFRTNAGFERLFCLTTERRSFERSALSGRRYHLLNFQRKLSWHPAYQAAAAPTAAPRTQPA